MIVGLDRRVGLLAVAFLLVAVGIYALLEARPWVRTTQSDGCVNAYEQIDHPHQHHEKDTYFTVGGSEYHLNSSFWAPGFKAADSFQRGDRVRLWRRGDHVVDLKVLSNDCAGP